MILLGWLFCYS